MIKNKKNYKKTLIKKYNRKCNYKDIELEIFVKIIYQKF